jgi:DNA-binding transcriptional LysR family regulator
MVELRRLQHLLALADERHFGRAAERVHLSQPAFSRSIQAIEAELGVRLFDREIGAIRPTPAGEFLIERARRLLFDARCLHRDVDLFRDSGLGDTAFGVGPFPAATLLPSVLVAFRRQYPGVGLRVEINNWHMLHERLHAEDIEFFVADVSDLPVDPALEIRSIGRQPGSLYARREHALARRESSLAEVWAYGVAATRLPVAVKGALAALLGLPAGEAAALALECDDTALLKRVALETDTVLAATDAAVRDEVDAGTLVRLKVRGLPALHAQMGLAVLRNRTLSPTAQRVIVEIETVAGRVNMPAS